MLIAMALSTVPTPLYPGWEERFGIGPFGVTGLFAAFALGAVGGLLLVERRGEFLRDRALVGAAGACAALAALVLAVNSGANGSTAAVAAARFLSGAGAGAGAAVATSLVLTAAAELPAREHRNWQRLVPALSMVGLSAGPLLAGTTVGLLGVPEAVLFSGVAVLAGALAVGTSRVPPSSAPVQGSRPDVALSLRWRAFTAFATTGVFGALTPTLLAAVAHSPSVLLLGGCAAVPFAAGAVGAVVRLPAWTTVLAIVLGLGGLLAAIDLNSLPTFVPASALAGLGAGGQFRLALGTALAHVATPLRRAAGANVLRWAYSGLALPIIGLGWATTHLPVLVALGGFSAFVVTVLVVVSVTERKPGAAGSTASTSGKVRA